MYTIYKITNSANGRFYIGCTCYPLDVRLLQHVVVAQKRHDRNPLQRDIVEFGASCFVIEAIEKRRYRYVALEREMYWIKKLNSCCPNGYNIRGALQYVICSKSKKIGSNVKRALKNNTMTWLSRETGIRYSYLLKKVNGQDYFSKSDLKAINRILETNF